MALDKSDPLRLGAAGIVEIIGEAIEAANREVGTVNVLIAGDTGVGKSTLINTVFHGRFATTGQGEPVTRETRKITKEGFPLAIFDTRGLELDEYEEILSDLKEYVLQQNKRPDAGDHIHVAWMCFAEDSRRVENADVELHKMLGEHMPVVGVITKARSDQGFRAVVQRLLPGLSNVVRVRALDEILDDGHRMPPYGLDDLVEVTAELIPEALHSAFATAQKVKLQLKRNSAHNAVKIAAGASAIAGASPIPFSDAASLVPIQIGMLVRISKVFGVDLTEKFLRTLAFAVFGTSATTLAGRAVVSTLLKLFPGVGTVAGAAIAATTAAALTTSLGELYIAVLVTLTEDSDGVPSADDIEREFKNRLATS